MNFEEDNKIDYFDGPELPEKPKEPKRAVLSPEDPRYWDEPEDEFEHLIPDSRSKRLFLIWGLLAVTIIAVLLTVYIWIFTPKVTTATQYGYIESIDKEGTVFQTYEGILLPYKSLMDTVRPYEGDFVFSTTNSDAAVKLKKMQFHNSPVRVEYSVYRVVMPWRGNSRYVITRVDSVREKDILPPDRQPETVNPDNRTTKFAH